MRPQTLNLVLGVSAHFRLRCLAALGHVTKCDTYRRPPTSSPALITVTRGIGSDSVNDKFPSARGSWSTGIHFPLTVSAPMIGASQERH